MDTRTKLQLLLDYKAYYHTEDVPSSALESLVEIPTVTLIGQIAWMNAQLFLRDLTDAAVANQQFVTGSLIRHLSETERTNWSSIIDSYKSGQHYPFLVYNFSNLLLYQNILPQANNKSKLRLTTDQAKDLLDAFLTVNYQINQKINKNADEFISSIDDEDKFTAQVITNFIYQKDYQSSTDFSNQVVRGHLFFQYLNGHKDFQLHLSEYYAAKHVKDYKDMFKVLLAIFGQIGIEGGNRNPFIDLRTDVTQGQLNRGYIQTLLINDSAVAYTIDESFGLLRNRMLYQEATNNFILLNINFLLDQFYKAQVFAFNSFLKSRDFKRDFLAIKGKEFMEDIYFSQLIRTCFSHYKIFTGKDCINSNGDELCDAYMRDNNKILLVELKDTLLNAEIKNSGDSVKMIAELHKKFVANQHNKKKGISQLRDALIDIDENGISIEPVSIDAETEFYPVIVYTDNSFGTAGVNKLFAKSFDKALSEIPNLRSKVRPITFINLNFLEVRELYLSSQSIDLFDLISRYHHHLKTSHNSFATFEVFCTTYMEEAEIPPHGVSPQFSKVPSEILKSPN